MSFIADDDINFDKDVIIELSHIMLELKHGRNQHMRHFVDQYYCYQHGLINRNGKAKWDLIFWKGYVSEAALKLDRTNKKLVVKEHVVPMKVIVEELLKIPPENISLQKIKHIVDELLIFATITKSEDALLSANGLKSNMPAVYSDFNELVERKFDRYHQSGIKLIYCD